MHFLTGNLGSEGMNDEIKRWQDFSTVRGIWEQKNEKKDNEFIL